MRGRWALLPPSEFYFDSFGKNMRISGLLEVIFAGLWQSSSSSFLYQGADSSTAGDFLPPLQPT